MRNFKMEFIHFQLNPVLQFHLTPPQEKAHYHHHHNIIIAFVQ